MEYDLIAIGKRIRDQRRNYKVDQKKEDSRKTSQEDFGYILGGYDRRKIAEWEKGKELPPLKTMLRMCELFDCELGYLLCEHDTKTRAAADIQSETGLSEKSITTLKELKRYNDHPMKQYLLIPPLAPFIDKFISDGTDVMKAIYQIILDTDFEERLKTDTNYEKYKSLYDQFKNDADGRTIFRDCMTEYGFDPLDSDLDKIYDIFDGKAKRMELFTIQDVFMDLVKDFIAERQDDHGKREKK